ncbi:hypothetical protein [Lunatimonas salinarum]|uniref:hypothetical protein n=1 Tax=Lunatimonas salinarum TaxID=1774590 RepID=UPI001AE0BFCE|nr:hypothetical protein [Lunatimonas salinarum]
MAKIKHLQLTSNFSNPFLGPEREKLWTKLDENARPISREELIKKAKDLKKKKGS